MNRVFLPLKISLFLLSLFIINSCKKDELKANFSSISKISLISIRINNACVNSKTDRIRYPNVNFAGEEFRKSFVDTMNQNITNFKITYLTDFNNSFMKEHKNAVETLMDPEMIYIPGNISQKQISPEIIKTVIEQTESDAWATIDLKVSIWSQNAFGQLSLYNTNNVLIWQKEIDIVSTYIIKDEKSPYYTEFDKMLDSIENQANHKSEIKIIFKELGELIAREIEKTHSKLFENRTKTKEIK